MRGDAARHFDKALQHAVTDFARPTQRQGPLQTADQTAKILVVLPGRQGDSPEAAHQLIVSAKGVARLLRADADERDPEDTGALSLTSKKAALYR